MYDRRSLVAVVAAMAVCAAAPARAAPKKFPDFPPPPADRLKTAGDQDLAVGVYVMGDAAEQQTYFNVDLARQGVTPIWVSIANRSADRTFLFDINEMTLTAPQHDNTSVDRKSTRLNSS